MAKIIELQKLFELYKITNVEDSFKDWALEFMKMPKKRQKEQFDKYFIS